MTSKAGAGLAKVLGIKLDENARHKDTVTRGESLMSINTADTYVEEEPTVAEWFREITPSPKEFKLYLYSLFPFTHWIGRYNLQWLYGDLVAGMCFFFWFPDPEKTAEKLARGAILPIEHVQERRTNTRSLMTVSNQ